MKFFLLCFLLCFGLKLAFFTAASDDQLLYHGFTAGTNLTVDEAASVTSNGLLELTNGSLGCKGHAFYPTPLHFRKSHDDAVQSFSVAFVFAIHSSYPIMSRQGLAFVVAPSMNFSSALANQYLGLMNSQNNGNLSNHIFAIELDTVLNIEFKDNNTNHVGIDINSLQSIESYPAGYYDDRNGTFQDMVLASGDAMQVWVDYNGDAKKISVTMAPLQMEKPTRPLISADYDLSSVLQDPSYIGFSSSGGEVDSRHYVLGWSFGMNKPAPLINIAKLPKLPRPKHQSKLLKIILPIASAIFVFAVGSMVILLVRRKLRFVLPRSKGKLCVPFVPEAEAVDHSWRDWGVDDDWIWEDDGAKPATTTSSRVAAVVDDPAYGSPRSAVPASAPCSVRSRGSPLDPAAPPVAHAPQAPQRHSPAGSVRFCPGSRSATRRPSLRKHRTAICS
ncbi:hypothetical protein ZWY2020_037212 [Hordeum vulgare]|nr:hypothetical protein ZWY2020_037212 [Hordeum vulgare]